MYNFSVDFFDEMTSGPDFERHLTIVPFFCNGSEPIDPNTGVGSLLPVISTVIQFSVSGMMILP
ncbi:MAG: hypothetical protein JW829_05145 [Pirellulales bacterium]|nr:hypothetical protein [Pirellulales bacterium]